MSSRGGGGGGGGGGWLLTCMSASTHMCTPLKVGPHNVVLGSASFSLSNAIFIASSFRLYVTTLHVVPASVRVDRQTKFHNPRCACTLRDAKYAKCNHYVERHV